MPATRPFANVFPTSPCYSRQSPSGTAFKVSPREWELDRNKTMEFMLEQQARFEANQARFEANFAKSEGRLDRIERVAAHNNRLVGRLARAEVGLRSEVRRHKEFLARHEQTMAEIEDKLNALIDFVDRQSRKNGRS
jgi:hypothetical protein